MLVTMIASLSVNSVSAYTGYTRGSGEQTDDTTYGVSAEDIAWYWTAGQYVELDLTATRFCAGGVSYGSNLRTKLELYGYPVSYATSGWVDVGPTNLYTYEADPNDAGMDYATAAMWHVGSYFVIGGINQFIECLAPVT